VISGFVTVKFTELLAVLFTVTTTPTVPATIPEGTTAVIDASLQFVVDATTLPNFTVLLPLVAPKLLPVMVTDVPEGPEIGDRLAILGATARSTLLARTTKEIHAKELYSARRIERILSLHEIFAFRSKQRPSASEARVYSKAPDNCGEAGRRPTRRLAR
jgi:hypothetical protein